VIRAFLAVKLPDAIRDQYAGLYQKDGPWRGDLRWVRPENLHITLRFLGDIAEAQVESLRPEVERVTQDAEPFRVTLGNPGCFGPRGQPRVLWFALDDGAQQLGSLAEELEEAVRRSGFAPEKKPWRGHLTVARSRRVAPCGDWEALLSQAGLTGLSFEVRELTLFSSQLGSQGPTYTELWTATLNSTQKGHESE
jgi:2'-5' RNA ligase